MPLKPLDAIGTVIEGYRNYKSGNNPINEAIRQGLLTSRSLELSRQIDNFADQVPDSGVQDGITTNVDWRARLRPKDGGKALFWYGDSTGSINPNTIDYLLKPLHASGGLVWQYTPNIMLTGTANYKITDFHGQNYPLVTYKNSAPPQIPVTSEFTATSIKEARYLLGVMHFLKVATKAFSGDAAVTTGLYGTPPPVMLFEYLGAHGFNKVPVVVTSYNINYTNDVDYVPVKTNAINSETTYVPTVVDIQVTLQPSYTPHKLRKRFDLGAFATGQNYKDGFI